MPSHEVIYDRMDVMEFIRAYHRRERHGPSFRELAAEFQCSLSTMHAIVDELRAGGHLIPNPGKRPGFIVPMEV